MSLENLIKEVEKQMIVSLKKKSDETGINHEILAEVKFAVDISGSMNDRFMSGRLYSDGTINEIIKRFFAVAKVLDDNGEMEVYPFSIECKELDVPVNNNNYQDYVEKEILNKNKIWYFGGTTYKNMIELIMNKSRKNIPQLILGIVDGDTGNKNAVKKLIIESAKKPIFWIFTGIGKNNRFDFLESLDEMPENERLIDNVHFQIIKDIRSVSEPVLYKMISDEYIKWFYKAKEIGIF